NPVAAGRADADHDEQQVAFDHRGASDAEEILHDAEFLGRVHLPQFFGLLIVNVLQAVEHALGAEDIDAVAVDDREAARAAAVAVLVDVIGWVFEGPQQLAGFAFETLQTLIVADSVKDVRASAADRRHGVAAA